MFLWVTYSPSWIRRGGRGWSLQERDDIAENIGRLPAGEDRRFYAHAGPKQVSRIALVVDGNPHWDALHDLDIVAGGVFRGEEGEGGAGSGHDALHLAGEFHGRIGVDREFDLLARFHIGQLPLLVVGRDPGIFQ